MSGGTFGIDVPNGDPGELESAAADLRGAAGVLGRVSHVLGSSGSVSGWSGIASMTFENRCVTDAAVAASGDGTLQVAARVMSDLADALRRATREAKDAVHEAQHAHDRLVAARADADEARGREAAAALDAGAAATEIAVRQAVGDPAGSAQAALQEAEARAGQARTDAAAARMRAATAEHELEAAQRRGRRVVRAYHQYADRAAAELSGLAAMAPTVTPLGPPPAPAPSSDDGDGGILDGLGKGLGDVWNEGKGLVTGAVHHVNVFDPDQLADTWSNDFEIGKTIVTHPLASGEAIVSGVWAPIKASYEHGGIDEAAARAVPSLLATIAGGKGVTKLSKVGAVGKVEEAAGAAGRAEEAARAAARAPLPGDAPRVLKGGSAPDGSFIPDVVEGDHVPLDARPHAGRDVQRAYGRPADERGLIPTDDYSGPGGRSWTPDRIEGMRDPRAEMGLPDVNAGRFKIDGELIDTKDVLVRHALPLDGRPGGGLEYLIPDPAGQVRIVHVEGITPHL